MFRNAVIRLFINSLSLGAASLIFSGIFFNDFGDLLIASIIFGLLNISIKPILIIFTLPSTGRGLMAVTPALMRWPTLAFRLEQRVSMTLPPGKSALKMDSQELAPWRMNTPMALLAKPHSW